MISIKQLFSQKRNWLALLGGILLGLSAPGVGWWPLGWVAMAPCILALTHCIYPRHAFFQGLLWGSVYHMFVFFWMWGLHPLAWMGFHDVGSLTIAGGGWFLAALSQGIIVGIIWLVWFWLMEKGPRAVTWLGPPVWVAGLWFLNLTPIGLPWGFLAYSQAPVDRFVESSYNLTFWGVEAMMVYANMFVARALLSMEDGDNGWLFHLFPAGLCAGMLWISADLEGAPENTVIEAFNPVAIQGNIPIELERLTLSQEDKHGFYQYLIRHHLPQETGMIVLPEGVENFDTGLPESVPFELPENAPVLVTGALVEENGKSYNSVTVFNPKIRKAHLTAKRYLVPFGETTPIIPESLIQSVLSPMGIDYYTGFSRAPFEQNLMHTSHGNLGALVCFEVMYPNISRWYRKYQAQMLVGVSNLGWFHQHGFLERHFLAAARFRAAEAGIPLVLVTNTGVSALIDYRGQIITQSQSGLPQTLTLTGVETLELE